MFTDQTLSLIIVAVILGGIITLSAIVIIRRFIAGKMINAANQYLGMNVYMQYQNADKRCAIEEVMFKKEDDREDALSGDSKPESV